MEIIKLESKDLALSAVFASLYAVAVIIQGLTASASIQLRVADCLIPLVALFGPPSIIGVSVGCFFSNAYLSASMQYGVFDIFLGPLANLAAATIIFKLRRNVLLGCAIGSLVIGIIVGGYLWLLFPPPDNVFGLMLPGSLPACFLSILSIAISSLVALCVFGYTLLKVMSRPGILKPLKTRGLKVYL